MSEKIVQLNEEVIKGQKQLVSYAEFLDFQRQKQLGQHEA